MTLGEIIKKYRKEHDMSQDTLAKWSGISKAYISVLERNINPTTGEPPVASLKTINALASAMGTDFDSIFDQLDPDVRVSIGDHIPKTREQDVELDPEARMIAEAYQMADDYPRRIVRTVLEPYFPKGG